MTTLNVRGVSIQFDRGPATDQDEQNVVDTLALVPVDHLELVRRIAVWTPPQPEGGGLPYAGGGIGVGYPRLSIYCFDPARRPNNRPYNLTLLHEIGHLVDYHYHCMDWLQGEGREHLQALQRHITISSSRRTRGLGEYFADGYQKLLVNTAPREVSEAIKATPAFPQHVLQTPPGVRQCPPP